MLITDRLPAPDSREAMRGDPDGDHVMFTRQGCHCYFCGSSHHVNADEISLFDFMVDAKAFYVQHRQCKPPKDDHRAPFALMKTRKEFDTAVDRLTDPLDLSEVYQQIGNYRRLDDTTLKAHPLYDGEDGFKYLYTHINRRARQLGLEKYNSGKGYYRPMYFIEDKKLTPDDVGRWLIYLPPYAGGDRTHKDCQRAKLISWNAEGVLAAFLRKEERHSFDSYVWDTETE